MKTLLVIAATFGFGFLMHAADAPGPDVPAALRDWLGDQPGGVAAAVVDADGVRFSTRENSPRPIPGRSRPTPGSRSAR